MDLCARLRELHTVRPSTPILIFSSGTLTRQDELDAFDAGAWGILSPPFNPQELLARLEPLVDAKRDVDDLLDSSFVDPLTGFYNVHGLMRRIAEISAETGRSRRPLAWVVLGPAKMSEGRVEVSGSAPNGVNPRGWTVGVGWIDRLRVSGCIHTLEFLRRSVAEGGVQASSIVYLLKEVGESVG